jgi:putative N-acetyltransferase (TIGR04045 family)
MILLDPEFDAPVAYSPCEFRVKWADGEWEYDQARRLRRAVFCVEQGVFVGDDTDAIDARAQTLVAVSCIAGMSDQVVGTVRIHRGAEPQDDGIWWGSRLAVHAAFRSHGALGATLIRLAVTSAHALGCQTFLAQVQSQNRPLFEKLGWTGLSEALLHGRPHVLMQADLDAYPPCHTPLTGFVTRSRGRANRAA